MGCFCFNRLFKSMVATTSLPRFVAAILLLSFASSANAQVGVTLCACSPATYTFQLNFAFTCNDTSISGAGLNRTECFVSPFGFDPENTTDFVPVAINAVDILELDQQLAPFTLTPIREDFRDGNEFKYTSVTATEPNLTSSTIPGGLQMNIIGVNIGEQIGWTLMTDLTLPNAKYCPAFTASPTSSPTGPEFPSHTTTSSPTAAPATVAPATGAPSTAAPATVEPTVSQPLATIAPATMAPSERVCPPIWGKGTTESKGKGYYSPSSSISAKGSSKGGSSNKAGKEGSSKTGGGSSKGSLAGSLRSKYVAPEHTDKKSKYESKKHGDKLQKPSYSDKSGTAGKAGEAGVTEETGKAGKSSMSFRRLSKDLSSSSSSAPSSSSSSLSKGYGYDSKGYNSKGPSFSSSTPSPSSSSLSKGYGYNSSEPVSNIYRMSSGKGQGSSSMDSGKGIDSGKGTSVSKGYVMYDPHCYPQKKSRSSSASQMSKTSEISKGSSESGKGTSDEGKGSVMSIKGSSGNGKGEGSYKTKKHSSASNMSMSKLHSKFGESGKAGKAKTHSLKGTADDEYYNKKPSYYSDKQSSPSKEPIAKPSPISPPTPKGKGSDTEEHVPSSMSASSVKHKEKKSQASEKHSMFSKKKSSKYHDKKTIKPSYPADDEDETNDESMPTDTPTRVDYYQNATTTPYDSNDHIDIDHQDDGDDPAVVGGSGDGIDILGFQEEEAEEVVSYQDEEDVVSYQADEEEEDKHKDDHETKNERRVL